MIGSTAQRQIAERNIPSFVLRAVQIDVIMTLPWADSSLGSLEVEDPSGFLD